MALSGRRCPDCGRRVTETFEETITGREVCPECAHSLAAGSSAAVITGDTGSGFGVWAMLKRRIRRPR